MPQAGNGEELGDALHKTSQNRLEVGNRHAQRVTLARLKVVNNRVTQMGKDGPYE